MIPVYESYRAYVPPAWLRPTVERLLGSLASEHTAGLQSIVLTSSQTLRGKTGRVGGRKYRQADCGGFYHRATRKEQAWVEIVANNITDAYPRNAFRLQFIRDIAVSAPLFHEIGHHLDATVGSASRGGEAAAEDWRIRLSRVHFNRKYWYLRPFLRPLIRIYRFFRRRSKDAS